MLVCVPILELKHYIAYVWEVMDGFGLLLIGSAVQRPIHGGRAGY